jgi:hypothetical protein
MGNESDDDESAAGDKESGLDDEAQGSLDTVPLDLTNHAGEIIHKGQLGGVIMSVKTPEGELLFCGYLAEVCRRPNHQHKRLDPDLCVTSGVYSGVLNATKKVIDGIVSSQISLEERKRQAAANYQDLAEAVFTSAQKRLSEDRAAQKTPSVIQFNLEDHPSEKATPTPRQTLINSLAAASDSPMSSAKAGAPAATTDTNVAPPVLPPDVGRLITDLTTQIQTMATLQAKAQIE